MITSPWAIARESRNRLVSIQIPALVGARGLFTSPLISSFQVFITSSSTEPLTFIVPRASSISRVHPSILEYLLRTYTNAIDSDL